MKKFRAGDMSRIWNWVGELVIGGARDSGPGTHLHHGGHEEGDGEGEQHGVELVEVALRLQGVDEEAHHHDGGEHHRLDHHLHVVEGDWNGQV
jgi:hypothetical protein